MTRHGRPLESIAYGRGILRDCSSRLAIVEVEQSAELRLASNGPKRGIVVAR
jgi:hypothetical protein